MKEAASPAKTDANNRQAGAQRESHAVVLPPPAYGIDFLDRRLEKDSPAAQGERLAPIPGQSLALARLVPEQHAARQAELPKPAGPAKPAVAAMSSPSAIPLGGPAAAATPAPSSVAFPQPAPLPAKPAAAAPLDIEPRAAAGLRIVQPGVAAPPQTPAQLQPQSGKAAKAAHQAVAPKPAVKRLPSQPAPQPAPEPVAVPAAASADAAPAPAAESGAALAEEPAATPEQQKTQDKLEAASPESVVAGEPVDTAAFAAEPEPPAELEPPVAPPAVAGEMAAAPPPADDAGAAQAPPQPTAQEQSLRQAEREQAAEQQAEVQAEEQAEAQPPAAQLAEAPAAGGGGETGETAELSPAEKAAGLAAVGEELGGEAAAPADGGGAGGGGGGGEPPSEADAPDTSAMAPEAGLAAAAGLPAGAAIKALGGVGGAVGNSVQQEGERLQGELPVVEVGGEAGGTAVKPLAGSAAAGKVPRSPAKSAKPSPAPKPLPEPPPSSLRNLPAPRLAPAADGALSAADVQKVQSSIRALPGSDPGLALSAGPAPSLNLSGEADPAQIAAQQAQLQAGIQARQAQGAAEVAAPAGEDDIRVRRPKEALKAPALAVPAGPAGGAAEAPEEAVAIIAEAKKGAEVRAAIGQAQGEVAAQQAEHRKKVTEEQSQARRQMDELQAEQAGQQDEARRQARAEVGKARADWSAEQQKEVAQADAKTQAELAKGEGKIAQQQRQADSEASQHIAEGEQEAGRHRREAEAEAGRRKGEAETETRGVFAWAAGKVSAFFDKLKEGLVAVFEAAKKRVRAAIEQAKKLAVAVIEKARAAVVSIIRAVGDALIAIGDALLAAFPSLRAKWRAYIESKVKAAEELVNKLADALKRGVQLLLDKLGKGLERLLDAYQKAMLAALDAAKAVAKAAIQFAQKVADALGNFVVLVKDIAQNPGQWLANLGAAVKDGIKNHLWKAFSAAVKSWFNDKIEGLVGIGRSVWEVLKKGGIAFKEVAGMVWEGLKAAIPTALIGLLIEKLLAMIVPAAGAVMVVVEGIKAAWGSVQRIVAAVSRFIDFLKAVKAGGAGPQFASMLAAAAIVVIDFVANWLLRKLRGPASKIGDKIKAIAKKIMAKIKSLAKKAGRWLKGKLKGLAGKLKGWKKKFGDWRKRRKDKKAKSDSDKQQDKQKEKQQRLDKAVEAIRPEVAKMLAKGVSKFIFKAKLLYLRIRHRLTSLQVENGKVIAKINPEAVAGEAKPPGPEANQIANALIPLLEKVVEEYDAELASKGETKDQIETAKQQILDPKRRFVSLDELPDDVRQAALRFASKQARNTEGSGLFGRMAGQGDIRVQLGQDVMASVGHPHFLSRMEIEALGGTYGRIAAFAEKGRADFGLPHSQVIGAISASHPSDMAKRIADFKLADKRGSKVKKTSFERRMRRMSILNSLEAARLQDAAVAMQIAADIGATPGHAKQEGRDLTVSDLMSPEGSKAPQTPVGAASQPGSSNYETGTAKKRQRVGEIANWLINEIRADLVINNGFTVGPLIDALGRFLHNQRGVNEPQLKMQLMGFLKSRHGR